MFVIKDDLHFPSAIPALKPVVHDLFISKNQARADSPKELDTQREVAFTMLLRLTQYPEVRIGLILIPFFKGEEDRIFSFCTKIYNTRYLGATNY